MKKINKVLCTLMALGMACSLVACSDGDKKTSSPEDTGNSSSEASFTLAEAWEATQTAVNVAYNMDREYTGSFTYTTVKSSTDVSVEGEETETETRESTTKVSYNADTKEGFSVRAYSSSTLSSEAPDNPEESSSVNASKTVKAEDTYYVYNIYKDGEDPQQVGAYKQAANLYTLKNSYVSTYTYGEFMTDMSLPWLEADSAETVIAGFNSVYASDANKTLETNFSKAEDGTVTLSVKFSAALSATIEETPFVMSNSMDVSIQSKEGKLVGITFTEEEKALANGVAIETGNSTLTLTVSYAFDKTAFDAVDMTNAPEIAEIYENTSAERYLSAVVSISDDFSFETSGMPSIDLTQTTAEQVATIKAHFATAHSTYGVATGVYIDEAMTTPLADDISTEDWNAIETLYVKAPAVNTAVYLREKMTFDCDANWKYILGIENTDRMGATTMNSGYPDMDSDPNTFTYRLSGAQYGVLGTVVTKVDGTVVENTVQSKVFEAGVHTIEYTVSITDPNNLIYMYM